MQRAPYWLRRAAPLCPPSQWSLSPSPRLSGLLLCCRLLPEVRAAVWCAGNYSSGDLLIKLTAAVEDWLGKKGQYLLKEKMEMRRYCSLVGVPYEMFLSRAESNDAMHLGHTPYG